MLDQDEHKDLEYTCKLLVALGVSEHVPLCVVLPHNHFTDLELLGRALVNCISSTNHACYWVARLTCLRG